MLPTTVRGLPAVPSGASAKLPLIEEVANSSAVAPYRNQAGRLSKDKIGLIAVVIAILKSREVADWRARETELRAQLAQERENLFQLLKGLSLLIWTRPLLTAKRSEDGKLQPASLLNWGNACALAAIILACIAAYYTKAYSSYKDRAANQSEHLKEVHEDNSRLRSQIDKLIEEKEVAEQNLHENVQSLEIARAKVTFLESREDGLVQKSENIDTRLEESLAKNSKLAAELAGAQANLNALHNTSETYKGLWKDERNRAKVAEDRAQLLQSENDKLQAQLASRPHPTSYQRRNRK